MWVIASIPFWIIGAGLFGVGIYGGFNCLRTDQTADDVKITIAGMGAFLVGAGVFFLIAAKVAG